MKQEADAGKRGLLLHEFPAGRQPVPVHKPPVAPSRAYCDLLNCATDFK